MENLPEKKIDFSELKSSSFYNSEKTVFFGHYWKKGDLNFYKNNICCLDYSIAKGGKLVAYQYKHEKDNFLNINNLTYV